MDFQEILVEVMPLVSQLLVILISAILVFLSKKANEYIKGATDAKQLELINLSAKQIVLFVEQVAELRGFEGNEQKKEYAVNELIAALGNMGIAITMFEADKAIEAAVLEFTSPAVEMIEGIALGSD